MTADLENRIVPYFLNRTEYMTADLEGRIVPYFFNWTEYMTADLEGRTVPYFLNCTQVEHLIHDLLYNLPRLVTKKSSYENPKNRNIVQIKRFHCAAISG